MFRNATLILVAILVTTIFIVNTTNNLIFGKHPLKTESFFAGVLDEICIYNRALTDDEVLQNFRSEGEALDNLGKLSSTWGAIRSAN